MGGETIREAGMALIANVLYQPCPDCGQPEPERSACACETCKEQGELTAALRAAFVATPDQPNCGGSGLRPCLASVQEGWPDRCMPCSGCNHPVCPVGEKGGER